MAIRPGVEVEAIKSDAAPADGNLDQVRPNVRVENRLAHAEIGWCIAPADKTRLDYCHESSVPFGVVLCIQKLLRYQTTGWHTSQFSPGA